MTCAADSTTGSGFWQPMHSTLCPAEACGSQGVVNSPNHPGNYPQNLEKTDTIQVEQGLIISLEFTAFDIEFDSNCRWDHLTITDGDGTTLMQKSCGGPSSYYYYVGGVVIGGQNIGFSLPPAITSRSNTVNLVFVTNGKDARFGWSVNWTAVTQGVVTSPNYPDFYPNNLEKTETIQVEQGLILSIQFTAFNIEYHPTCNYDHLTITDGDGTTLMEKSCGSSSYGAVLIGGESIGSSLPPAITSRSNLVNLVFRTDWSTVRTGWSVSWIAVTPGSSVG